VSPNPVHSCCCSWVQALGWQDRSLKLWAAKWSIQGRISPTVKEKTVQQEVFGWFSIWKISKIYLVRQSNGF